MAMQPIYESYQQQQQFTANAAHELRSPLASLLATIEAILRVPQANPEDTQTMLYKVEKQGRRLSNLIADLLVLSSLEQNSSPKKFQSCCLNGIPKAEQNRIFDRFYRDGDRSRKTGGTGLGLAIAQAIVHHHQGHLTVKSEQEQGSLFMIHLPYLKHSPTAPFHTSRLAPDQIPPNSI
ncbi:hypothetical protein H6G05_06635 [Pseudanabaena sp. FACHB-1050]|uniref:histidine kinase n=2 Tax=Phormidium tenue TaxID=126344 RepID=A0ABR8C8D4_9CYAN|nr:hypothetical protein [Phormidium tenue FACHB-1050]